MSTTKTTISEITSRLAQLVNEQADGNVSAFAKNIDVSQATLHNYIKGRPPSVEAIHNICSRYLVNLNWLITGDGPVYLNDRGEAREGMAVEEKRDAEQRIAEDGPGADRSMPWNDFHLGMGDSMELLVNIHKSGNKVLIRAINANLMAFNEAIENKERSEITINAIAEMREQMKAMNGKISILEQENQDLRQKILSRDERDEGEAVG